MRRLHRPGPLLPVLAALLVGAPAAAAPSGQDQARPAATCLTASRLEALRIQQAGGDAWAAVRPVESRERLVTSPDGRFLIHQAGAGAVADRQADEVARVLSMAREILVGQGGWLERDAGGQPMDVHLVARPQAGPSLTVPLEHPDVMTEEGSLAAITITGPPSTWAAQALHQYLHALQMGYSVREAAWLYEASALLLEERLKGGGAITADLLAGWMERPERSLTTATPADPGPGALFLAYLTETRGADVLKRVWERAALIYGDNALGALNASLRLGDFTTLPEAWREFTIWNGVPEPSARPTALYTSLSAAVPPARPAQVLSGPSGLNEPPRTVRVEPLGAAYVVARDLGDVGAVQVELETDPLATVSADALVSWRHAPGGWLAVPLRFQDGRARLGVPLETGSQLVLVVRNDALDRSGAREVTCTVQIDPGFPFELAFLSAEASPGQIDLSWGSERESRLYGWMVYRATDPQGPFQPLSRFPVPSMGDSDEPLGYDFVDTTVIPGTLYYYQVEGITVDGLARRSPVVTRRAEPLRIP